ncbi:WbqC family protein [Burkholderia sp. Ac-20353]|uniref:WbqC family protein n=1 Tax=Burkholderia sp. Ac-20353 TaxID=2703894 RepID=UPI00197B5258|nr:WbqC family protein [Burkholderia sp. Ac-20353]MBN3790859.1 WbqC family protein [Burkholderia sp. Ac-20353]
MKLAIMQPYLFPYVGYFQLAAAVDKFVFYDDVAFIKNGWINRNRILLGGHAHYLTVPLVGASSSRRIDEVQIQPRERWQPKLRELLRHAYAKAPHYAGVTELVERILSLETDSIARLAAHGVMETCRYIGIAPAFVATSTQYRNAALKGEVRVLDICAREQARTYVNLPGGRALYDRASFAAADIDLAFVEPELRPYPQFGAPFVPGLSILDLLMFNRVDAVRAMLLAGVAA